MVALLIFISTISALGATASADIDILALEERKLISPKNKNESQKIDENSDYIFFLTGKYSTISEHFGADINFLVLKRKTSQSDKDYLYLKDNAYIGFFPNFFQLNVGRKIFHCDKEIKALSKDGVEGVSIEKDLGKNFKTYFFLYDYYRGFPVFEKNLIRDSTSNDKENGKRSRHGLELDYEKDDLFANIQFLYLNLGSWGKFSTDDSKKKTTGVGDGDFLYQTKFQFGKKWKSLFLHCAIYFSRGLDKASYNPVRQEKSIPITGEALFFSASWIGERFSVKFNSFLPDSDKKNKEKEILEMGFVGMGTNPIDSVLISQSLNFYPSQWITPYGLEKNESVSNGKKSSLYLKAEISFNFSNAIVSLETEKILPRLENKESKGEISLREKDYSKQSLTAFTISIQSEKKDGSGYFLKFSASKLMSTKEIGISSTLMYFQAGISL